MLGVGLADFVPKFRNHEIHLRRPPTRRYDDLAEADWVQGTNLVHITSVAGSFRLGEPPHVMFTTQLLNGSVHDFLLSGRISGHIEVEQPSGGVLELGESPELEEFWGSMGRRIIRGPVSSQAPLLVPRNYPTIIEVRQRLSDMAVRWLKEREAGGFKFYFTALNIEATFIRAGNGRQEQRNPEGLLFPQSPYILAVRP